MFITIDQPQTRMPRTLLPATEWVGERRDPSNASTRVQDLLMNAMLDDVDSGIVVCKADGTVLVANRVARSEMQQGRVLRLVQGQLCAETPTLRAALTSAARSGKRQLLRLGAGAAQLFVFVRPMTITVAGEACVAITMGRATEGSRPAVEMLGSLFGLSMCEQDVLAGLFAGKRVKTLAQERKVAVSTVRSQVLALRTKMGAASVAELIAIVAKTPPICAVARGLA